MSWRNRDGGQNSRRLENVRVVDVREKGLSSLKRDALPEWAVHPEAVRMLSILAASICSQG